MARFTATDHRCQFCLYSRVIVSENDIYWVCRLSEKKNLDCLMGVKDHYDGYSDMPKKGE